MNMLQHTGSITDHIKLFKFIIDVYCGNTVYKLMYISYCIIDLPMDVI